MSSSAMKGTLGFKQQRAGRPEPGKKAAEVPATRQATAAAELQPSAAREEAAEATLRQFDLSSKYGPCMGISRLERWERAAKLGLEPPADVRELILRYGVDSQHNINVFHHDY